MSDTWLGYTVEADLLDKEAARLEAQADDREDRSARWYGGGSYSFVLSMDTADQYRKEAAALRSRADVYRLKALTEKKG